MFICVHFMQDKNWQPVKATITIHTNTFFIQQEQEGMILFSKKITVTSLLHQTNAKDLTKGIIIKKPN